MSGVPAAAQAAGAAEDDSLIKEGDHVVFDEHGDRKSLVVIRRNGWVWPGSSSDGSSSGSGRMSPEGLQLVR